MRSKKAKALRAIAKNLALAENVSLLTEYSHAPMKKVAIPVMNNGSVTIKTVHAPSGPTRLTQCWRSVYKTVKKLEKEAL